MTDDKKKTKATEETTEVEIDLEELDKVSGGSMRDVFVEDTVDISDDIIGKV